MIKVQHGESVRNGCMGVVGGRGYVSSTVSEGERVELGESKLESMREDGGNSPP